MTTDSQKTKYPQNGNEFMDCHFVVLVYDFIDPINPTAQNCFGVFCQSTLFFLTTIATAIR